MSPGDVLTILAAALAVVSAVTALVVQTQKLITIAERYMLELQKHNELEALGVGRITDAIVGISPTSSTSDVGKSPTKD